MDGICKIPLFKKSWWGVPLHNSYNTTTHDHINVTTHIRPTRPVLTPDQSPYRQFYTITHSYISHEDMGVLPRRNGEKRDRHVHESNACLFPTTRITYVQQQHMISWSLIRNHFIIGGSRASQLKHALTTLPVPVFQIEWFTQVSALELSWYAHQDWWTQDKFMRESRGLTLKIVNASSVIFCSLTSRFFEHAASNRTQENTLDWGPNQLSSDKHEIRQGPPPTRPQSY
jgi:hypothetical protein